MQTLKTTTEQAQVINQNSLEFLKQAQNQPHFDVVFLDPPFHFGLAEQAIALLEEKKLAVTSCVDLCGNRKRQTA